MDVQGQVVEETVFEKVEEETIESLYVDVPHNTHIKIPEDTTRTLGNQDLSMDQNLHKITACEPCIKQLTNDIEAEETDLRQSTNTEHLLVKLNTGDQNTQHVVIAHQDNISVQALNVIQDPNSMDTGEPIVDQKQKRLDSQEYSAEPNANHIDTQDPGIKLIPDNTRQQHSSENEGSQEQYTILNSANVDSHEVVIIQSPVSQSNQHQASCHRPVTNTYNVQSADKEQSSFMETNADTFTKSLDNLNPHNSGIPESLGSMDTQDIGQNLNPNNSIQNQDDKVTEVTDASVPSDNTEQMAHTQVDSCSVPGVCSVCHSLFTQTTQPVLLHSDTTGPAYTTTSSVDRIIHGSINPQLIQGCILTSAEGRNPGITQYLILQDPEDAAPSYPLALSPVAVGEMSLSRDSSCGPEAVSDMDALEGMMEVVVVQQYKCKMCHYKSASKTTLLRHVRERHIQTVSKDEQNVNVCKVARSREEDEEEEEDDIVDAGAIDDPDDDSDYSPGEDANPDHNLEPANGTLAKERPRRRPGRPRKIQRIQGLEIGTDLLPVSDSKAEDLISPSVSESKDPSCNSHEEQKPLNKTRGWPLKHLRGKKYRRYKSRRYYKSPNKQLLRPFLCRVCGSRFLTQEDFTFHVSSHDGNDPQTFRCQQCNYRCRRWSSLKEHMFNHKGNKPHKCDQCDYTSVYKKDVIRHSAVHTQERKSTTDLATKPTSYPCPVCNRVYHMQKRLTQHLKTHSAEKPHMCDKCGKAFKKRYTFKMHLLTHLQSVDNSRYKCEFCEYICEDRKRLLNHQLTHMNDKPFKCSQCKYHTYRQDFLLSHEANKHAGGKPFACDYCHFTTKHKKNLRLHVQCRHAHLLQEWVQRNPEETPCRRRPFFSLQQIEELKQQHVQPENPVVSAPVIQEVQPTSIRLSGVSAQNPHTELTYHMLQQPQPGNEQPQDTLEAAAIIYEQGEEEDLTTRAALDLLLNMSAQRDGQGGPLQVAVVKSGTCGEGQGSEVSAQEPHMAQVLTLHMDEREVTGVQDTGYEEAGVQQITINTAFTTAEYGLINTENIQTSLCSDAEIPSESHQTILDESVKDRNTLQVLHKPHQSQVAADHSPPPPVAKKFSCKICGSSFWGRAEMESHKRAHVEGGSGFKCHDCTFIAASWPEVRDHMSLHSDLRPHRCNQCSFASRNRKDLSRHAMTHTNHRPHSCHLCGQRFNRKGHLKFHIQRLHGGVSTQQLENEELATAPSLEEEHIFLTQEETVTNQENTAYIQEITTADGQTLQQLVTADNQVQYIISQEGVPHLIPQEYVVLPEGHHIQVQDGQITHIQYEPGAQFLQDPQIHFVPMSPTQQLLTQEQLQAAAHSAVTAVADAAVAQTVYTTEREQALQQEIEYDVITLTD